MVKDSVVKTCQSVLKNLSHHQYTPKNITQNYITDSYPFVCAFSKYSKMTVYFSTRAEACSHYFIFKVISGLCPHHEEYFDNLNYYTCKNMKFDRVSIKNKSVTCNKTKSIREIIKISRVKISRIVEINRIEIK